METIEHAATRYAPANFLNSAIKSAFISGAEFATLKCIPCSKRTPEEGQVVMFWLDEAHADVSHGSIMIGRYHSSYTIKSITKTIFRFSTPGHGWEGTHWCELPGYLINFKPE